MFCNTYGQIVTQIAEIPLLTNCWVEMNYVYKFCVYKEKMYCLWAKYVWIDVCM